MTLSRDELDLPSDFRGVVRLFPLPDFVLFPHVVHALHIFEPRYREMLEDALAGDLLVTMARLLPGWERDYEGRPPIDPTVCIGRITAHSRLDDGRYNILLHGVRRGLVMHELAPERSFRTAEVAVLEDIYPAEGAAHRSRMQRELLRAFQQAIPDSPAAREEIEQLLGQQIALGTLTDVMAFTLKLDLDVKQQLLAQTDVDRRSAMLLEQMRNLAERSATAERPKPSDN